MALPSVVYVRSRKRDADIYQKAGSFAYMKLGFIGLGKMGKNMVLRLLGRGYKVIAYNKSPEPVAEVVTKGAERAESIQELVKKLEPPRIIWLMVPSSAVEQVVNQLANLLSADDIIIDGGNSFYKDTVRRGKTLESKKIRFIDVGVSGGPGGAATGACLMVGGDKKTYQQILPILKSLATKNGFAHFEGVGAGHFIKMVHNGVEYGAMEAIAEGFEILAKSDYKPNLKKVANLWNHKSVVESRLIGWLEAAFTKYGNDLKNVTSVVGQTGEGKWTVETAKEMGINVPIIEGSLNQRLKSSKKPTFAGKILSAMRGEFGGHSVLVNPANKKKKIK